MSYLLITLDLKKYYTQYETWITEDVEKKVIN